MNGRYAYVVVASNSMGSGQVVLASSPDNNLVKLNLPRRSQTVPHPALSIRPQYRFSRCRSVRSRRAQSTAAGSPGRPASESPAVGRTPSPVAQKARVEVVIAVIINEGRVRLANLDVFVLPARQLVGLSSGEVVRSRGVEEDSCDDAATDKVNSIVVAQVHRGPPNPPGVDDEQGPELGEAVAHEECLQHGVRGMERGEGTKRDWGRAEVGRVKVNPEDGVHAGQASGGTRHPVFSGHQAMLVLIPRRRAGEAELDGHTQDAHPPKSSREDRCRSRRGEDEHDEGAHGRRSKVHDTVG